MIKVHYQGDQEELYRLCDGMMNTLIDTDRGIKSAASDLIPKSVLERFRPDKDHFLIHCVAMGDTETYGPNKNADGWPKEALEKRHHTFVTEGHFFKEHRNRDPKKKLGDIKYAAYDPKGMRRVELLMWGNKEKAAAEYEKAKAGEELSFSMSARVPDDVCSCCNNRAKSAAAYCSHLRDHALQYIPEFRKYAYANNEWPTFFDNSVVARPADRIARYLAYKFSDDDMRKAASVDRVILGTEWAEFEGIALPTEYAAPGEFRAMAAKIAAAMSDTSTGLLKRAFTSYCGDTSMVEDATEQEMELMREVRPGTLFRVLAKNACVMPFSTFAAYATGKTVAEAKCDDICVKAGTMLRDTFAKLASGVGTYYDGMFRADGEFTAAADTKFASMGNITRTSLRRKFGIGHDSVMDRAYGVHAEKTASTANKPSQDEVDAVLLKLAGVSADEAQALASAYADYQTSAMLDIAQLRGDSMDSEIGIAASHNNRTLFR